MNDYEQNKVTLPLQFSSFDPQPNPINHTSPSSSSSSSFTSHCLFTFAYITKQGTLTYISRSPFGLFIFSSLVSLFMDDKLMDNDS
ncbi:hypothetical protein QVD17_28416 [Tagetes erecta]|uniref:Transmembrane protein n=1 Tax=Tagetes erecta TaxID=13708 RepID=A0AAD8NS64_TARER|nr:hypothetical protein QVD17_28416 [Tagetes erecta]